MLKWAVWSKREVRNWLSLCISNSQTKGCDAYQHWQNSVSSEDPSLQPKRGHEVKMGIKAWEQDCQLETGRFTFKDLPKSISKSRTKSRHYYCFGPATWLKQQEKKKASSFCFLCLSVMTLSPWKLKLTLQNITSSTSLFTMSVLYSASIHAHTLRPHHGKKDP